MDDIRTVFEKKCDYQVKIENFEGPLDLLLHLIKEAKIDIKDVFISKVTDQYIAYMAQLATVDMDRATEFLDVAATILEIKSNALLPKIEDIFDDSAEDPAQRLIRQLEEYKMLKEAAEKLKVTENINRFYKAPDESVQNVKIVLKDMTLDGLLDAFSRLLIKVDRKEREVQAPKEIWRDPFTVDEKIMLIEQTLARRKQISFDDLFDETPGRNEVITTFQALLEVIKKQFVTVEQSGVYQDILITLADAPPALPMGTEEPSTDGEI